MKAKEVYTSLKAIGFDNAEFRRRSKGCVTITTRSGSFVFGHFKMNDGTDMYCDFGAMKMYDVISRLEKDQYTREEVLSTMRQFFGHMLDVPTVESIAHIPEKEAPETHPTRRIYLRGSVVEIDDVMVDAVRTANRVVRTTGCCQGDGHDAGYIAWASGGDDERIIRELSDDLKKNQCYAQGDKHLGVDGSWTASIRFMGHRAPSVIAEYFNQYEADGEMYCIPCGDSHDATIGDDGLEMIGVGADCEPDGWASRALHTY